MTDQPSARKAVSQPKHEMNPQIIFQYSEQVDPQYKQQYFLIKIMETADMREKMQLIINLKADKCSKLQLKEKSSQFVRLRQKYQAYKKMDERVRQQEKKRNPASQSFRYIVQYENYLLMREKYNFSLFQTFENRGKYNFVKFGYNAAQHYLTIKINKRYFLNQLNLSRKDLFNIGISFTRTWQHDYYRMISILWKYYIQTQKNIHYTVTISKIDMISATFDICYLDKKIYRFRYSPFQFRNTIPFRTDHHFTGYYQSISCIHDLYNTKIMTADNQYYYYNRLFIFDDLTDKQIFIKIFARSHIFFQMYSISKGIIFNNQNLPTIEMDDYFKKCLGQFYFTSIRLKKFMFTWSFKVYKRLKSKNQVDKEVILNVPFYFQQIKQVHNVEPFYRIRMQLLQKLQRNSPSSMFVSSFFKEELVNKIRQWYFFVKQIMMFMNKDRVFIENQKLYFLSSRKPAQYEDYQLNLQFFSKDKIDKFFIGLLLIISTAIDRYYFGQKKNSLKQAKQFLLKEHQDRRQLRKDEKLTYIQSPQTNYIILKKQYIYYYHSVKMYVRHRYLHNMFSYNKQDERQKTALNNYFNANKASDYKIKCGEWKIEEIYKIRHKYMKKDNQKQDAQLDKQIQPPEIYLIQIHPTIRAYLATLVRHIPLRMIYKDIIYFLDRYTKTCYSMPQKQSAVLHLILQYQIVMILIIRSLLKEYYYCQFKQKDPKIQKQLINLYSQHSQFKAKHPQEIQFKSYESERLKALQKMQDLFSKIIVIKIITSQDIGFKYDKGLLFDITFKIMEFKNNWITKCKEGYIIVRVFQNRIEFEKEFNMIYKVEGDIKNKKITEEQIRKGLEKCQIDTKLSLVF